MQTNHLSTLTVPVSVNLEITDKCNLSCGFCYNAAPAYENMMQIQEIKDLTKVQKGESLMLSRKKRILEVLDKLALAGVFEIRLFGGEFTVFKSWREILEYAHERGFFISFVSNGYLIDAETAKFLADHGVKDCTISIHGKSDIHDLVVKKVGSFDRAMNAIKYLKSAGVSPTVAYTPNISNINELEEFIRHLCEDYGVTSFSISRLFSDNRYEHLSLEDYHYLLEVIHKCHMTLGVDVLLADSFPRCQVPMKFWRYLGYCSQGVAFAQVDFNGNIKHCSATAHSVGNVVTDEMSTVWSNNQLVNFRNLEHLPKSCKICPIFCGGGCTVSRGVNQKFSPDEFIPWPKDEGWVNALLKTAYNRMRKSLHRLVFWEQYKRTKKVSTVGEYPLVPMRYRSRPEGNGFLVMFEGVGTKMLTPIAFKVLQNVTGVNSLSKIGDLVREDYPKVSDETIKVILEDLL